MLHRIIKNERVVFILLLLVVFLFFSYSVYNINTTNRYIDSLLKYNYYQKEGLDKYLTERINQELSNIIKSELKENETSAIIAFNKSSSRSEQWVNVFGIISILFFVIIGFLLWVNYQQKEKSDKIIEDLEKSKSEAKKLVEEIEKELKEKTQKMLEAAESEIKRMLEATKRTQFVTQLQIRNTAERFSRQREQK